MSKSYERIEDSIRSFIEAQHVFFVATAPSEAGHVNLSPKGLDSLRVLDDRRVAYLDFIGSGVETIAHLRDDGRIVLMFCAFEGSPKIVRIHGRGEVVESRDDGFAELRARFPDYQPSSVRSVIVVHADRVSDSCGYGVPLYRYEGERSQLGDWAERKGPEKLEQYQAKYNATSIDGLAGLRWVGGAAAEKSEPG